MKRSAFISPDGLYRWSLTRDWSETYIGDEGSVCWVMLNPSTADEKAEDPTLHRIMSLSHYWHYGALEVVNLYPWRTAHPSELRRWLADDLGTQEDRHANASVVRRAMKAANLVVVAWGAVPWAYDWSEYVIEDSWNTPRPPLYCLGETAQGFPKHPLARGRHRVPNDQQPVLWREGVPA